MRTAHLFIAITTMVAGALAQGRTPQAKAPAYFDGTLPLGIEKLPPNFIGQDIEAVIKRVNATGGVQAKSEFETAEQYKRRLSLPDNPSQLVFLLRVGENDGGGAAVSFNYDADKQTMTADLFGLLSFLLVYNGVQAFMMPGEQRQSLQIPSFQVEVKRRLVSSRQYDASNKFGVKTVVTSEEWNEFGLAFHEHGILSAEDPKFSWQMTAMEAKDVKPFLRLAVLCVQSQAHIYKDDSHGKPTIDRPLEFITNEAYLPVLAQQVWMFDSRSGRILKKFAAN